MAGHQQNIGVRDQLFIAQRIALIIARPHQHAQHIVGRLLAAQGRHPFRPGHLHALIAKAGFKVLISQIYDPADPNLETDVQFGVTEATTGSYVRHDDPAPTGAAASHPWYSLDYTFVMERGEMTLPKPPIK
jgi:catechol 1,2-dioxygenase